MNNSLLPGLLLFALLSLTTYLNAMAASNWIFGNIIAYGFLCSGFYYRGKSAGISDLLRRSGSILK